MLLSLSKLYLIRSFILYNLIIFKTPKKEYQNFNCFDDEYANCTNYLRKCNSLSFKLPGGSLVSQICPRTCKKCSGIYV